MNEAMLNARQLIETLRKSGITQLDLSTEVDQQAFIGFIELAFRKGYELAREQEPNAQDYNLGRI